MVASRPDDLPNFESPPLVETVLSVQFDPLPAMRTVHLGQLWGRFPTFPRTEDQTPLTPMLEEFPETPRPRLGLQLQALEKPPIPRIWFISDRGNEMIQVQGDRFIKNWRKEGQGEFYPRYEAVKASFERDFQVFRQFLSEHKIGDPHINQCEVSYVNHITSGEGWDSFEDFDKVFRILSLPSSQIPGRAEDARVFTRFLIPDSSGRPVGRLYVEIQPALRTSDNKRMYVLQLTARGKIGSGTEFLDLGRRWIVKAFATITTPRMHEIWKRTDRNGDI